MSEFGGAVDLSEFKGTLGPREAEAMVNEMREIAATREQALRDRVHALAENEGLTEAMATLTYLYGDEQPNGERVLVLHAEQVNEARDRIAQFGQFPERDQLIFRVKVVYAGRFEITKLEPTEAQLAQLAVYEQLPELSTNPQPWEAIVQTKKGLRVFTWAPLEAETQP